MRKHAVDAYFCGHDHSIQEIRTSRGGDPLFIVSGAGGYNLHKELKKEADSRVNEEAGAHLSYVLDEGGFVSVRAVRDGSRLELDFVAASSENKHSPPSAVHSGAPRVVHTIVLDRGGA